jgi:hypothetical protein
VLLIVPEGLKLCQTLRGHHEAEQQVRQIGYVWDRFDRDDLEGAEVNRPVLLNLTELLEDASG